MGEIDPKTLMDCDLPIVDVRTPGEYASGRAPGAVNMPLEQVRAHASDVAARLEGPVALMCASGRRAEQAREALADAGYHHGLVVADGMGGWEASGGATLAERRVWPMERQVRFAAGLLVLVGVLASLLWPPAVALSAFVGAGLVFAAVTDTCGLALLLARMPWNRVGGATRAADAAELERRLGEQARASA